jgi:hypothetical protein
MDSDQVERDALVQGFAELAVGLNASGEMPDSVAAAIAAVVDTICGVPKLLKRIEQLEQRPELKHVGVWREGKAYRVNNLVTAKGGMWICRRATKTARPGQSNCWELVVKRGEAPT